MLTTDLVNHFRNQSILVAGDTYAEREFYGEVSRLAPEAPVPVVKIKSKRLIPGGAANVARNIATLGGKSLLYCGFGQDEAAKEILNGLLSDGVGITISSGSASTRLPERYRIFAASQQLLQILRMPCIDDGPSGLPSLSSFLAGQAEKVGAVVIYDQGYGFVTRDLIREVERLVQRDETRVVVDARPDHVGWYGRAALYTFNAEESLAAAKRLGFAANSVIEAGNLLKRTLDSPVLVTQGGEGMTIFPMDREPQKIPANRVPIADRAGAGQPCWHSLWRPGQTCDRRPNSPIRRLESWWPNPALPMSGPKNC
jgi:rfaE bifunctional protein kinase chain/domain